MEFGARRADGCEAALDSSLYAIMAGCHGTSNIMAAQKLGIKALGTMAHSFVEAFLTEYDAFLKYALTYPDNAILLVDTYDTLRSGVVNAIKVFKYMQEHNYDTSHIGIRIDSGDLAYLSKEARKMLDNAGFPQASIVLSNGLDANKIMSLQNQDAKFNSLGVGDNISKPEGNVGCVYKLVETIENGVSIPKIKLSNDAAKTINPGYKELYRAYDNDTGYAIADILVLKGQNIKPDKELIVDLREPLNQKEITNYTLVKLQKSIFINGKQVYKEPTIFESQNYCNQEMAKLYPEVKRLTLPHTYYVDGTKEYAIFDLFKYAGKFKEVV